MLDSSVLRRLVSVMAVALIGFGFALFGRGDVADQNAGAWDGSSFSQADAASDAVGLEILRQVRSGQVVVAREVPGSDGRIEIVSSRGARLAGSEPATQTR